MHIFYALICMITLKSLYAESQDPPIQLTHQQSFTMRPARLDDVDMLFELICELAVFEGKDLTTLPVTRENLKKYGFEESPCFHVEFAENQNGIVGYALYSYVYSGHQGTPFLYVDDLYVKPSERGHGIGTSLLKQLARYAEEKGCCRMEWHVFDWNESAISFYKNLGGNLRKDLLMIRMERNAYQQWLHLP